MISPTASSGPRDAASVRIAARAAALFVVAVGVLVLVGWLIGLPALIRIVPGAVAMVPNTALAFLLSGVALWLRAGRQGVARRRASLAAAAGAGLLGLLTLVEYVSGASLGIDELLFRDPAGLTAAMPGRMAAATALSFVVFAAALSLSDRRETPWVADTLALVPGLLGLFSLTGYAYGVPGFYWVGIFKGMAIHTALAFIGLTAGALLSHPDGGASRLIRSDTAGGVVARRILPVALGAPLLLAWLGLLGEKAGVFGREFEDALIAVSSVVVLLAVLVVVAERLRRADEDKGRAREALREAERKYRSIFENAVEGVFQTTPDGRFATVNSSFARMLGYESPEEILSAIHDIESQLWMHPERRHEHRRLLEAHGFVKGFETELRRKDGTSVWVSECSRAVCSSTGAVEFYEGTLEDITERKQAEDRIRQLNRLLRTMTEINQAIVHIDDKKTLLAEACRVLVEHGGFRMAWVGLADRETGRVVPAARAGEASDYIDHITVRFDETPEGRGPAGMAIRTERHVVIPDLASEPTVAPWRERMLAHGFRSTGVFPFRVRGEVGGTLMIHTGEPGAIGDEETALLDELAGDLGYAIETLEIRGEHRRAENALRASEGKLRALAEELENRVETRTAELKAANSELEAFSYSVSHDLRAPLRAVDGFSRILLEDHAAQLDGEGRRLLDVVRTSSRQMGQLIDDLLSFSRIGRQEVARTAVDMEVLAEAAFRELLAAGEEVSFTVGPLPHADADPSLMRQVWMNLISNALKFTRPKAERVIEVGARPEQDRIVYWVRDNGVGFDMAYADKLFGVFQRLHSSHEFEGTGVGLALVQRIVHRHGGEVWAEGKVGQGAIFSFSLPRPGGF